MPEVRLSGPLFDNPTAAVRHAVETQIRQAALLGQRLVQEQLVPGHGVKTGTFRRSVVGDAGSWNEGTVQSPLNYAEWLETGRDPARTTRFQGYHMFQNAADKLEAAHLEEQFAAAVAKALGGE